MHYTKPKIPHKRGTRLRLSHKLVTAGGDANIYRKSNKEAKKGSSSRLPWDSLAHKIPCHGGWKRCQPRPTPPCAREAAPRSVATALSPSGARFQTAGASCKKMGGELLILPAEELRPPLVSQAARGKRERPRSGDSLHGAPGKQPKALTLRGVGARRCDGAQVREKGDKSKGRGKRPLRVSRALRHGTGAPAPTSPFPCKALHVPTEERHRPAGSGRFPPGNKMHELGRRRPSRGTQRSSPGGSAAAKLIPLVTQRPAAETTHAGQKWARSPVLVTHLPAGFPDGALRADQPQDSQLQDRRTGLAPSPPQRQRTGDEDVAFSLSPCCTCCIKEFLAQPTCWPSTTLEGHPGTPVGPRHHPHPGGCAQTLTPGCECLQPAAAAGKEIKPEEPTETGMGEQRGEGVRDAGWDGNGDNTGTNHGPGFNPRDRQKASERLPTNQSLQISAAESMLHPQKQLPPPKKNPNTAQHLLHRCGQKGARGCTHGARTHARDELRVTPCPPAPLSSSGPNSKATGCRGSSVPKNHRKAATSFQDRAAGGGREPALSKAQEKGSEALAGPRRNRLEWGTRAHEAQLIIHTPGISEFGVPRGDPVTPGGRRCRTPLAMPAARRKHELQNGRRNATAGSAAPGSQLGAFWGQDMGRRDGAADTSPRFPAGRLLLPQGRNPPRGAPLPDALFKARSKGKDLGAHPKQRAIRGTAGELAHASPFEPRGALSALAVPLRLHQITPHVARGPNWITSSQREPNEGLAKGSLKRLRQGAAPSRLGGFPAASASMLRPRPALMTADVIHPSPEPREEPQGSSSSPATELSQGYPDRVTATPGCSGAPKGAEGGSAPRRQRELPGTGWQKSLTQIPLQPDPSHRPENACKAAFLPCQAEGAEGHASGCRARRACSSLLEKDEARTSSLAGSLSRPSQAQVQLEQRSSPPSSARNAAGENTRPPSGLGDRQDQRGCQRSSLLQPLLLAPSLIPEAANPIPVGHNVGLLAPSTSPRHEGELVEVKSTLQEDEDGATHPSAHPRPHGLAAVPQLITILGPSPSASLHQTCCSQRPSPSRHGDLAVPTIRSQNPGATRACGERANPPRHRHRPRRQMPLSPCSKMPAISRGLMKGARSSIPATSCRGKRLGCLRHQHPAPTICSASILKSAGARRSASPSLPTAEGGGGFLAKPRGSDGSASDLGSGSARGRGYFGASERRGASFPRGVSRARGKGGRAEVGDCSVIDRCLEPKSWGSSSSLLAELVPKR
ncbi:hypothetical protein Anapl_10729 [Anas platyrhynchos]|uniref:Uncharacterized protein n=1 Tax=Anas platyrhynchos TaxID=8839 RepID=R0LDX1_ANAPL|nr:hypothetical protein Anapl_10729 [Anas platyrhynchos]